MDGPRDARPRKVRVHQTSSEKAAVEELGHICSWDDDPRGAYRFAAPAVCYVTSTSLGDYGPETLRIYQSRCCSHTEGVERNPA